MQKQTTLFATATLSLALTLTACAQSLPVWENHDGPIPDPCREAYAAAALIHARSPEAWDFDLAIATCDSYADWTRAVATDPSAIGMDAMAFLAIRCGEADALSSELICISVNH